MGFLFRRWLIMVASAPDATLRLSFGNNATALAMTSFCSGYSVFNRSSVCRASSSCFCFTSSATSRLRAWATSARLDSGLVGDLAVGFRGGFEIAGRFFLVNALLQQHRQRLGVGSWRGLGRALRIEPSLATSNIVAVAESKRRFMA